MSDVVPLKKVDLYVNEEAVRGVEALLERLRSGETVALALVEVRRANTVADGFFNSEMGHYHLLMSGSARLHARLAMIPGDDNE